MNVKSHITPAWSPSFPFTAFHNLPTWPAALKYTWVPTIKGIWITHHNKHQYTHPNNHQEIWIGNLWFRTVQLNSRAWQSVISVWMKLLDLFHFHKTIKTDWMSSCKINHLCWNLKCENYCFQAQNQHSTCAANEIDSVPNPILSNTLTGKPNTQIKKMLPCSLYETIQLHKVLNFHFPVVKISFPNFPKFSFS